MAKFTSSANDSLNEVFVKVREDTPDHLMQQKDYNPPLESLPSTHGRKKEPSACSSESSIVKDEVAQGDGLSASLCPKVYSKSSSNKDYFCWFLEDDFDIVGHIKETGFPEEYRPLRIAQWVLLLLFLGSLSCTLSIPVLKVQEMWGVLVWKWEVLFLVIISGKLVSGWCLRIIVFFFESNFHLKIGVLYVMYGIRNSIQNTLWLSLVTISWHFIVAGDAAEDKSEIPHILKKIMLCFLVGTFVWLLKTLVVKLLAASFHLRSFFKRIRVSLYKQYVIKKLGGDLIPGKQKKETGGAETDAPKLSWQVSSSERLAKKRLLALKVKRLIEVIQAGDLPCLSTVDEDLPVRSDEDDEDEYSLRTRDRLMQDLADQVFQLVAGQSNCITQEHLKDRLGEDKFAKAQELFIGAMRNDGITKNGFTQWMVAAYKERRTLALSLNDTKTAVDDLHHMMNAIVAIMILIVSLIICGAPVTRFLIFVTTQFALAAYIFGSTCTKTFESIIFLFLMHPYDVGDRCEVDGVQMVVDEMTILTTVFLRHDNQKIIYPNDVLANKPIGNYCRSPAMLDEIEFSVHISTPQEKIKALREKINKFIEKKSDYWFSDTLIVVKNVEDMNRLNMVVWPKHAVNHHDMGQRWKRRSELIEKMIRVFRKLEIEYRMLPIDMNVRNISTVASDRPPSIWKTCSGKTF